MNSHNHPMLGSIGAWFYRALAGINMAADSVAYKKLIIKPQMVRDLTHASGSIYTINGLVSCSWERSDQKISLQVTIPFGSEAEIYLPVFKLRNLKLTEGGHLVWSDNQLRGLLSGVKDIELKGGNVLIRSGSGQYVFELTGE